MDWLSGLTRAIDYVEAHLEEDVDYNAAAREAACSGYYFQRVFGLLCGMTLGEYIRNRRLTLAGCALREPGAKVIDVALRFGYESPESFARAFQKFHGVTPSEARRNGVTLRSFSRLSVKLTLCGGTAMDYKILEKEAFTVMEKMEMHTVENEENNKTIPAFLGQMLSGRNNDDSGRTEYRFVGDFWDLLPGKGRGKLLCLCHRGQV